MKHVAFLFAWLATLCTPAAAKVALYAAVGTELTQYDVNVEGGSLTRRGSVSCPANVQYAWPHPTRRYLYVAWSNGGPVGAAGAPTGGSQHGVSAFLVDPATGALQLHGTPAPLVSRPVHITVDREGGNLLVAHTVPSAVTVIRIGHDGALGAPVKQAATPDAGIYAHQIRVDPSGRMVVLVTRGNVAAGGKPEDPGALKVYGFDGRGGALTNRQSVAPGGGFGFQPRHLDFHSTKPWVFLSVEAQSQLHMYKRLEGGRLSDAPVFNKSSLAPGSGQGQAASTVHVHPNGRFVYQGNRASRQGGENSIAVFAVNQATGEPTLIQNADTRGFNPRTFSLDPNGRLLVAANQVPGVGAGGVKVPASMAVFRVNGADGKLEFLRKYDVEASDSRSLFWIGLLGLP